MRIAILSATYRPMLNGVTIGLNRRVQYLGEVGHRVLLLSPDYSPIAGHYPDHADHEGHIFPNVFVRPVPSMPMMGRHYERNPAPAARGVLRRELARFRPDLLIAHNPDRQFLGYGLFPGVAYAKAAGIPKLAFCHTCFVEWIPLFYPQLPNWVLSLACAAGRTATRRAYACYDETLVNTRFAEQRLTALGVPNIYRDDFNGLDYRRFRDAPRGSNVLTEMFGIPARDDEEVRLGFVGRLAADKGWPFLLDALAALVGEVGHSRVRFIVAGDGDIDMRDEIGARLSALSNKLDMLGPVAPERLPVLYANLDIYVSAGAYETLGLTVLEAMGAGVPVLVPASGGLREVVDDDVNGLHFVPGDRADFLAKLRGLMDNAALRDRLGRAGRRKAAHFDWRASLARYEARLTAAVQRARLPQGDRTTADPAPRTPS